MKKTRRWTGGTVVLLYLCSSLTVGAYVGIDRPGPRDTASTLDFDLPVPEPTWTQSKNGFSAMLLLSDEPDDVLQSWDSSDDASDPAPVRVADTITPGVPIVAFVFFAGCEADGNGMCNASVDFTILRPDGTEYDRFRNRDLWKGKPAPPEGMLRLSAEYVGVVIEPGDPLGEYEFRVSVHDLVAGTTLDLRHTFTAIDGR